MEYKRIVLKLSGEALQDKDGIFNFDTLKDIKEQISKLVEKGVQVSIVVGGGNIFRGEMIVGKGIQEEKGHYMGMLATSINALGLNSYFNENGLKSMVMNAFEIDGVIEEIDPEEADKILDSSTVLIFGGGTGKPFVSTDTGAAWRAKDINADAILIAKNGVDGVYTADPKTNPEATHIPQLTYSEIIEKQLKVIDLEAASFLNELDVDTILFNMNEQGNIIKIWEDSSIKRTVIKK